MAITTTPLGFKKPDGRELVRNIDNVISDNAQKAQDLLGQVIPDIAALKMLGGLAPGDLSNAVADAVTDDLAGRDLIESSDPRVPQNSAALDYAWAVADESKRAAIGVDGGGVFHAVAGVVAPSFNDLGIVPLAVETGYVLAFIDKNGRAPLALRTDGTLEATLSAASIAALPITGQVQDTRIPAGGCDVVLLVGQSNMQGGGIPYSAAQDVTVVGLDQYAGSGPNAGKRITAADSLYHVNQWNDTGGVPRVGPGMEFGRQYLYASRTGRPVLLVPAALGSTTISGTADYSWDPDNTTAATNLYTRARTKAQEALALHPGNRLVAILWAQGEGDAGIMTEIAYRDKLLQIVDGFRAAFGSTVPFLVGSMVPDWVQLNAGRQAIDAAHRAIEGRRPFTAYVRGPSGLHQDNLIHYNAAGAREFGRRLFDSLSKAKSNTTGA